MFPALSNGRRNSGWKQPAKTVGERLPNAGPFQSHVKNTPATKENGLKRLLQRIKSKRKANRASSATATLSIASQRVSRLTGRQVRRKENRPRDIQDFPESRRISIPPLSVPRRRNNTGSLRPLPSHKPIVTRNGLKNPLEKIKLKKRGYTGVAQRANVFRFPEHVDSVLDQGTCFKCNRLVPKSELQDQSIIQGQAVGVCNNCYPEYLQYLEDLADDSLEDFDIGYDTENPQFIRRRFYSLNNSTSSWITIEQRGDTTERETSTLQKTRECKICGESRLVLDFIPATSDCQHEVDYCSECLQSWITSSLEGRGWDSIRCPATECGSKLKTEDIQAHADHETFDRYTLLSTTATLSSLDSFRWCLRPGCKSGQIHETGTDGPIFRCHSCSFKVCVIHDIKWHEGETCKQYDYRTKPELKRNEENASAQTINKTTKRCPQNSCKAPIEKKDGCDHMTCSKCRHEFCWLCLASYNAIRSRGNSAHNTGCRYHTRM